MLSNFFRNYAESQLAGALAAAQRELIVKLDEASRKTPYYSAGAGLLKAAEWQIELRARLIRDVCLNAIDCSPGESSSEVLEFAQARLLSEYEQIQNSTLPYWLQVQAIGKGRGPLLDFKSDLHVGMKMLISTFATPQAPAEHNSSVEVFISHSSLDSELAFLVVGLLRAALPLRPEQIRCTSVDGYRLPAGVNTDEWLRDEILGARLLVGIMSSSSLESAYVLFELGARWGTKQCLVPLLAPGMRAASLKGPVAGLNALSCESQAQLHQLVEDAAKHLGLVPEGPQTYQAQLDTLITFARSSHKEPPPAASAP
jgi:hypothetical protein